MTSGAKRQLEISDGSQTTLPGQAVKGNKRCKLGPTEQLRVVVRQILAGAISFPFTLLVTAVSSHLQSCIWANYTHTGCEYNLNAT